MNTQLETPTPKLPRKIAVIGGGISGLAAAHRLVELDASLDVTLYEVSDRLGGVLQTEWREGFLIEHGADMFATNQPWALELCQRIGFDHQLIETNASMRKAFIVHHGKLVGVPEGFTLMSPTRIWPMITTPLLSWRGKLRLAREYFTAAKDNDHDESLAAFARRRVGREVYERIVQPLISGIYTADPEKLSMAATMKEFVELEMKYGSIIRGLRKNRRKSRARVRTSGARYGMFVAPRGGMNSLVAAIAARLPNRCVRLNASVDSIMPSSGGGWQLALGKTTHDCDAVILATPARHSAKLLALSAVDLAHELASIPHASTSVVVLAYRREQIQHPLDGFGVVVPLVERRRILAGSFSSVKFAGRAPDNHVLLRIFVGGACQPELAALEESQLMSIVQEELSELIGTTGQPVLSVILRWQEAMPQYHLDHLQRIARIERCTRDLAHLELAGNAYQGVGIPFCIHSGEQAAERILSARRLM